VNSRKGFSLEFSDYRRYQRGDDLRYIDWNIYRRLDRLLLKVFTAEEEMNIYLLIDTSRSMAEGSPVKLDYAKKVAAALGYIGLKNLDRVGAGAFSSILHKPLTLGRGRKQILSMFNFLAKLSCTGETNLRGAIHSFTKLFPHAGLVIVVSDLFDPSGWRAALEELSGKNYQVLLVHIVDEAELKPKAWGDVALVDVEAGPSTVAPGRTSSMRRVATGGGGTPSLVSHSLSCAEELAYTMRPRPAQPCAPAHMGQCSPDV
jgi:uncharacterized protein (DUF58 family)